ncbi:MAG: Inositol-1-monophosphatase [Promethearchaeota archaeon]|nr:MAG: Inositol-1-monophosphatase [Candidatus Lokiarchaeota archaeon]
MSESKMDIDLLKTIALKVHENVSPLMGTKEGAEELERGAGGDITMKIDTVAETTIIGELERNRIDLLLISEEVGHKYVGNKEKAQKKKSKLIVDPIDGSTNSSRGIPFYSVSLAYAEGDSLNDIQTAVILDLSTKDIYWAKRGSGAYHNGDNIAVSERGLSDQLIFEIDFYLWNLRKKLKLYRSLLAKLYRVRVMGSVALSLCLVAEGGLDGYVDFRKGIRLVDIAAGYLMVKEAGGKILNINGKELEHELSKDFLMPLVVCNSNSELEQFLKNILHKNTQ